MSQICIQYYKSPYGELVLGAFNEMLCLCDWRYRKRRSAIDKRLTTCLKTTFTEGRSKVLSQTMQQLEEYFHHERKHFDLPLQIIGTEFQQQVWRELVKVPFGETATYRQLAEAVGRKDAVRAVASANGANAISIIIPCHRIIGSNGKLVGYAGGLAAKEKLLQLEQDLFN